MTEPDEARGRRLSEEPTEFGPLMRFYRERIGKSRNALCHEVGCDPSYGTRIEAGDREPPRQHLVEAFARGLRLTPQERDRLLVAGGYAPSVVVRMGEWDALLAEVSEVLTDPMLTPEERNEFRSVVQLISARWRGTPLPGLNPRLAV
jgi:hypothetical protein